MKIPKRLINWQSNSDNSLLLNIDNCYCKIYLLTDDIIRIRTSFNNDFLEESYVLTTTAWDDRFDELLANERQKINALTPLIEENEIALTLKTHTLQVIINKSPYYIQVQNNSGQIIYSDLKSRPYTQDQLGRVSHYSEIDIEQDCFYGFGEKTGAINKLRRRLVQNAKDTLGYDPEHSDPLYKHIPFYIKLNRQTQQAVGFFYHNTYESVFDMAVEHSNYHHRYSYFCADGGDLDLFILNGPSIAEVVERYTDITGKSAMLPIYGLVV
jgi:alpha-glucosidase